MLQLLVVAIGACLPCRMVNAQQWGYSILGDSLLEANEGPQAVGAYRFLAGGHLYGANENVRSVFPAASFLSAIPEINAAHPSWFFALGDVVRNSDVPLQVDNYRQAIAQIDSATLLIPGNHDRFLNSGLAAGLENGVSCFRSHGDLFILLPTEKLVEIGGPKRLITQLQVNADYLPKSRNVFVFSHRLLWALTEPGFEEMDDFANEPFLPKVSRDSAKIVYDMILKIAGDRPLYWFSGDIGASWSFTVFEGHSVDGRRHFYAAGIGDRPEDAFWQVDVDSAGRVHPQIFWLTNPPTLGSKVYDLNFWRAEMERQRAAEKWTFMDRVLHFLGVNWKGILLGFIIGVLAFLAWRRLFAGKRA